MKKVSFYITDDEYNRMVESSGEITKEEMEMIKAEAITVSAENQIKHGFETMRCGVEYGVNSEVGVLKTLHFANNQVIYFGNYQKKCIQERQRMENRK
jgi:hypothetical protein